MGTVRWGPDGTEMVIGAGALGGGGPSGGSLPSAGATLPGCIASCPPTATPLAVGRRVVAVAASTASTSTPAAIARRPRVRPWRRGGALLVMRVQCETRAPGGGD